MFGTKKYDRAKVYADAEAARGKGKKQKAAAGYRQILEQEPDDWQVHGKLAPLIAGDQPREAWASFEKAAKGHLDKGFADRALAVYRQAADLLPFIPEGWERVAQLHQQKGRKADAVKTLVDGQRHFTKTPTDLEVASSFLVQALSIEPWHVDASIALAQVEKKKGDVAAGVGRLTQLLAHVKPGKEAKKVLRARLGLAFTFKHLWSWLRGK